MQQWACTFDHGQINQYSGQEIERYGHAPKGNDKDKAVP